MTIHEHTHAIGHEAAGLAAVDGYWRAANYLAAGQIYLRDNALLHRALEPYDIKPRLLGHWTADYAVPVVKPGETEHEPTRVLGAWLRDVINRVSNLAPKAATVRQAMTDARARHRAWILEHGEDLPEIREWTWTS